MTRVLSGPILLTIFGIPLAIVLLPVALHLSAGSILITAVTAPFIYCAFFVLTAGVISLPFRASVAPGTLPRDLAHPVYARRRLYNLCWTSVYYNKPAYFLCLSVPWLKRAVFRLFGYRGSMEFTVYPDTWIRDLPLLSFGEGAYISNRATVGTNIVMNDGTILVDRISVGKCAQIGHLCLLAPGASVGDGAVVGVAASLGIRATVGENTSVQPMATLNHGARVGAGSTVGHGAYLGVRCQVDSGVSLPVQSFVGSRTKIRSQEQADALTKVLGSPVAPASGTGPATPPPSGDRGRLARRFE